MAKIPKAATSGGKGARRGAKFTKSPTGSAAPSVSSNRGGHSIGPTRCTARGSARTY